jgi:hypothetical protein
MGVRYPRLSAYIFWVTFEETALRVSFFEMLITTKRAVLKTNKGNCNREPNLSRYWAAELLAERELQCLRNLSTVLGQKY